jgi:hypothetical protein
MARTSSANRFIGAFILFAFLAGGVVSPVFAHAFHPHGSDTPFSADVSFVDFGEDPCVLCDATAPADIPPKYGSDSYLPSNDLVDAVRTSFLPVASATSTARGPPATA